jgi:hypothetical protein
MLTLLMNGKLHWAPISSSPQRILDLATGTGIWAIDIGLLRLFNTSVLFLAYPL